MAAPATGPTQPVILAAGPVTPQAAPPGTAATARFEVTVPAGWPSSAFDISFTQTSVWPASAIPLSSSIPGCSPVIVSPYSASNSLSCALTVAAGTTATFTYTAPLPVTGGYQDTLSAALTQAYAAFGQAGVAFTYGIAPSTKPGVTSFIAPVTTGARVDGPPPPVVAAGRPFTAEVVASGYNAPVSPLTVVATGPAGLSLAPDPTVGGNAAASFSCAPTTPTSVTCTGGSVAAGGEAAWLMTGLAPAAAGRAALSVTADPAGTSPPGVTGAPATARGFLLVSTTLPDLAISVARPPVVYVGTPYAQTYTIANTGGSAAATPTLTVLTPAYTASVSSSQMACVDTYVGHSGRGGGITHTGYRCTADGGQALEPGASLTVIGQFAPANTAATTQTLTVTTTSIQQDRVPHAVTDITSPVVPAAPAAPTGVSVTQNRGSLVVAFTPGTAAAGVAVTSTATATPAGGGTALAGSVVTTGGGPTGGGPTRITLPGVSGQTTYSVVVGSADVAGSAEAAPVSFTTAASVIPPGAPIVTHAYWGTASEIIVMWSAAPMGDSATTDYEIMASAPDSGLPPVTADGGSGLEGVVANLDDSQDWAVQVRALDGAGWGPWSVALMIDGP